MQGWLAYHDTRKIYICNAKCMGRLGTQLNTKKAHKGTNHSRKSSEAKDNHQRSQLNTIEKIPIEESINDYQKSKHTLEIKFPIKRSRAPSQPKTTSKEKARKRRDNRKTPTPNKRKRKTKKKQTATQKTKQAQKQDKAQIMLHNAIRIHINEI